VRITLSRAQQGEVRRALGVLSAPLDAPSADDWRIRAMGSVRGLLAADAASCVIRHDDGVRVIGDDHEPHVVEQYQSYYHNLDEGLAKLRGGPGLRVWTRTGLWSRERLRRSEYYNDFALPHRIHDSLGISVPLTGGSGRITYSFHQRQARSRRFGPAEAALMELLVPSFEMGESVLAQMRVEHDRLGSVLDAVTVGIVVFNHDERVLHVNEAFQTLVARDPEAARLEAEVNRLGRQGAAELAGDPDAADTLRSRVSTSAGSYLVQTSAIRTERLASSPCVLVTVKPLTAASTDVGAAIAASGLTPREQDVARHLVKGLSNRQIGAALDIKESTVRHHVEQILLKFNIGTRTALLPALLGRPRDRI
jgi:DNA-binding CsgD family transcriptional regulator/PAS domain-containing protein